MPRRIGLKCGYDNTSRTHLDDMFSRGLADFLEFSLGNDHDPREYLGSYPVRAIHAQIYDSHRFNPVDPREKDRSLRLLAECSEAADVLGAEVIIVHPERGMLPDGSCPPCSLDAMAAVLAANGDGRCIVENMPNLQFFLTEPEEIRQFLQATGAGFLLDVGHAAGYAFMAGYDFASYLAELASFGPAHWHVSDSPLRVSPAEWPYFYKDAHQHLGTGDVSWPAVARVLPDDAWVTLETPNDADQAGDADFVRGLGRKDVPCR